MADSEADKIRNKRLAKLGGQQAAATSTSTPDATAQPPQIHIDQTKSDDDPTHSHQPPAENPFSALGMKPQENREEPKAKINISPTSTTNAPQETPRSKPAQQTKETMEDWEDRTLSALFRVTLNPDRRKDTNGQELYYLEGVREDLLQEDSSIRISTAMLDQVLVEVLSGQPIKKPLDYLLPCWKRIIRYLRSMRNSTNDDAKTFILKEARRLCMSYCIFAITLPDMFGQVPHSSNPLTPYFLSDPDRERGIDIDFLSEAVARFDEDESIKPVLVEAIEELSKDLSTKSMNDQYQLYVTALLNVLRFQPLVIALTESPLFLPTDVAAQDIEKKTLLGPFFQLSPLQGEVALNFFSSPRTRDRAYIVNSQDALRMTLQQHQIRLFELVDRFIKSSPQSRNKTLDWFALVVNSNHKRRALRTDPRYVSSDGFMVNVTVCLDRLSEPFMDETFSKVHRIEPEYFRRSPRVDIQDETKISADQETSDKFYESRAEGTSNFISEVFFLTVAAHHYGTEAANTKLGDLRRQLKHMDKEIERLEREREKFLNQPPHVLNMFDNSLKRIKDQAERGHCVLLATEGVLLDEQSQGRAMSFMRYVIVWIMRMVSNVDFPKESPKLPLPQEQPDVFKCLPEYFIEDIVDHFKFMTSHMPHAIAQNQCNELAIICITFLRSSDYIKNPYLKSGLVSILFYGIMPYRRGGRGILDDILNGMKFALDHLLHALMQWYIECEVTGAHTQFYDKFNIRYEIFQVIKRIWGNVVYRENLEKESKENVDFFVRFVNLLLNDVTFVLDESFSAFNQISSLTKELEEQGAELGEEDKKHKEEALEGAQGRAKSYMSLTTETLVMLKLFTDALADAFTMPEIVQRLADMLDYNLDALVGEKQRNLKVKNPQEYNFNPKALLSDIVDVFLNLSKKPSFQLAVARDGRSYKPLNFDKAANYLWKDGLRSPEEMDRWMELRRTIDRVKAEDEAEEEDLGEIPEEFLDPLMATLMEDPVILPISKNIVNRSTIQSHLLSDSHDPFNRTPLKLEDVIPHTELKEQIQAFKNARKRKRQVESDETEPMDTT